MCFKRSNPFLPNLFIRIVFLRSIQKILLGEIIFSDTIKCLIVYLIGGLRDICCVHIFPIETTINPFFFIVKLISHVSDKLVSKQTTNLLKGYLLLDTRYKHHPPTTNKKIICYCTCLRTYNFNEQKFYFRKRLCYSKGRVSCKLRIKYSCFFLISRL